MTTRKSSTGALCITAVLLCLVFVLGGAQVAQADTVYTYTGNNFNFFYNGTSCGSVCSVSGSFSVSTALGANLVNYTVAPTSYSFADGLSTNTDQNSQVNTFTVSTDGSGNIIAWTIYTQINGAHNPCSNNEYSIQTTNTQDLGEMTGNICTSPFDEYALINNNPGTWTEVTVANTPEPASLALLGSGLIGLGAGVRRKFIQ